MKRILSFLVLSSSFLSISSQTVLKPTVQDLQVVLDSLDAIIDNTAMHDAVISIFDAHYCKQREVVQGLVNDLTPKQKELYSYGVEKEEAIVRLIQNICQLSARKKYNSFKEVLSAQECVMIGLLLMNAFSSLREPEKERDYQAQYKEMNDIISAKLAEIHDDEAAAFRLLDLFCTTFVQELQKKQTSHVHQKLLQCIKFFQQKFRPVFITYKNEQSSPCFPKEIILMSFLDEILKQTGVSFEADVDQKEELEPFVLQWVQKQLRKPIFQELCEIALRNAAETRAMLEQ